jgi:multiple sugar transport system permease protein
MRSSLSERRNTILLTPILILLLAIFAYPFARAFFLSFFDISFGASHSEYIGLDNFVSLYQNQGFWQSLLNSLYWTFGNLLIQLTVPMGIALLLNSKIKGIHLVRAGIMLPWVVPTVTIAVCLRWMLLPRLGIIAEMLSMVGFPRHLHLLGNLHTAMPTMIILNSWKFLPFGTLMILASLQTIPDSLYEAATVDGSSGFQRFRFITFPCIGSMMWFVGFLAFSWNFNTFDLIWLMTQGGPGNATQTLPVLIYRTAFKTFRLGEASAISIAIAFILIVIGLVYFRYLAPKVGT